MSFARLCLVSLCRQLPLAFAAVLLSSVPTVEAQDCDQGGCCDSACDSGGCDDCGDVGYCCDDCCCPPGTLFQWSYGTSFEGGPDLSEPLVTDRPDFTESATTVGRGVLQVEMGYTYTFDNDGTDQTINHSYPETLFRYGIFAEWLELRVGWNYANEDVGAMSASGSEDLYLGLKIALTPQECLLPEMALIPQMTVPTGADAFSSNRVLPGVNWVYGWELNEFLSTAGSSQINQAIDEVSGDVYSEFAQSWTLAASLTDRVGGYTEWYAFIPSGADSAKPEHYFNGGFTWLANDNLQFDVRAGLGLNDAADDYFVGTGMSVRFP